jgi:hypothetical protein
MIYAHARMSGDITLIQNHVGVFSARIGYLCGLLQISRMKNWTEFLVGSTLYTAQQYGSISLSVSLAHGNAVLRETANLLSISNQTNLAIKGIIAIKAMSVMSKVAGQSSAYSVSA